MSICTKALTRLESFILYLTTIRKCYNPKRCMPLKEKGLNKNVFLFFLNDCRVKESLLVCCCYYFFFFFNYITKRLNRRIFLKKKFHVYTFWGEFF
ncbi:hypothetical protein XENTR_v10022774 [Xenopus tropicalis]|nr:hypothetical protein XENTR_v10022774 [Xenopus tropicalis]